MYLWSIQKLIGLKWSQRVTKGHKIPQTATIDQYKIAQGHFRLFKGISYPFGRLCAEFFDKKQKEQEHRFLKNRWEIAPGIKSERVKGWPHITVFHTRWKKIKSLTSDFLGLQKELWYDVNVKHFKYRISFEPLITNGAQISQLYEKKVRNGNLKRIFSICKLHESLKTDLLFRMSPSFRSRLGRIFFSD